MAGRGFKNLGMWTRGVDTELFSPEHAIDLDLPRPIFVSVGRIAVEKNLEAFLSLDLPGSKVVIGHGPQEAELRRRFPDAKFLGLLEDRNLAAHVAAADVFVFPSRTDTFGVVQLEALACGVPIAAYPVTGPQDVVGNNPIGVLHEDLRAACLGALRNVPRGHLPRVRADPVVGEQRAAVHRASQASGDRQAAHRLPSKRPRAGSSSKGE